MRELLGAKPSLACGVEGWLGGYLGGCFEGDREPERLELRDEATGLAFGILAFGEVVVAEIFEHLAGAEEMPDELDQRVGNGDSCSVGSATAGDLAILGAEVASLGPHGGACGLDQCAS